MANVTASRLTVDDGTITWDDMTIDGTLTISGAATFDTNVTFDGDTAGQDLVWNAASSGGSLIFEDNVKAKFGDGGDLEIVHNGNDSYISAVVDGRDFYIQTTVDRALHLRQNSGERITLNTDDSITLTGNVGIGDDAPETLLHLKSAAPDISYEDTDGGDKYIVGNNGGNFRVRNATDSRTDLNIDGTGNVGIGTTSPGDGKHADADGPTLNISGNMPLILGSDHNAATRTNTTRKFAAVGLAHYTNAEEPTSWLFGDSDANASHLSIGGGIAWMNAVEQINFYTAGNTTTTTGTLRGLFNDSGNFYIYQNMIMQHTKGLYFDGGNDVYLTSASGNRFSVYSGGSERLRIDESNFTITGTMVPEADASRNFGSASYRWLDIFSSKLKAADGNASGPSHTFANDTTMGMYRPGTNTLALATGGAARIEMNNTSINYITRISVTGGTAPWCTLTAGTGCTIVRQDWTQPGGSYDPYYVKVWFEIAQSTGSTKKLRYTFTRGANGITFAHVTEITGEYPSGYQRMLRANCQTTDGGGAIFHSASSENFSSAGAWASTSGTNDVIWESAAIITSGGAVYGWVEFMIHRGSGTIPTEIEIDYS